MNDRREANGGVVTDQAAFDWFEETRLAYEATEAAFRAHAAQILNTTDLPADWPIYYAEWDPLEEATDPLDPGDATEPASPRTNRAGPARNTGADAGAGRPQAPATPVYIVDGPSNEGADGPADSPDAATPLSEPEDNASEGATDNLSLSFMDIFEEETVVNENLRDLADSQEDVAASDLASGLKELLGELEALQVQEPFTP